MRLKSRPFGIRAADEAMEYLSDIILHHLSRNHRVLWLVSGGSAIQVAKGVSARLSGALGLRDITVTLSDERYGPPGHKNSNWFQLQKSGFALPSANLRPILTGDSLEKTTLNYSRLLKREFMSCDYKLGLFGMGADGHTAGILPASPAIGSTKLAIGYNGRDFRRITMSATAVTLLDEAVLFAIGEDKRSAIEKLDQSISLATQPAQVLKKVKKFSIFSDAGLSKAR